MLINLPPREERKYNALAKKKPLLFTYKTHHKIVQPPPPPGFLCHGLIALLPGVASLLSFTTKGSG